MKTPAILTITAALACAPILAADIDVSGLPPHVVEACQAEGGRTLISREALDMRLLQAWRAGADAGRSACRGGGA